MSSNRRDFCRQAAGIVAGLGAGGSPFTTQQRSSTIPTPRASALMAAFGLRYPIFCAGCGLSASQRHRSNRLLSGRMAKCAGSHAAQSDARDVGSCGMPAGR